MSKNPKQVFGGYKSALTKKITSATTYVQSQREFSDRVEAKIDRMITEIRDQMSRWETIVEKIVREVVNQACQVWAV